MYILRRIIIYLGYFIRRTQSPQVPCHLHLLGVRSHCYLMCFLVTGRDVRDFKWESGVFELSVGVKFSSQVMTKACRGDMCYCMLSVQVPCSNERTSFPLHFYICYFLFLVKALKINSSMHHYANPIVLPLI